MCVCPICNGEGRAYTEVKMEGGGGKKNIGIVA